MKDIPLVVLVVEPGKRPELRVLDGSLESMQEVVGGYIEQIMPFEDEVALVCNEEGKLRGEALNRCVFYEDGTLLDIIAGTFFVCYAPEDSENYLSLPVELIHKYAEMFECPERFYRKPTDGKIVPLRERSRDECLGVNYLFHEHENAVDIEFFVDATNGIDFEDIDWHTVPKESEEYGRLAAVAKEWAGNLAIQKAFAVAEALKGEKPLDEVLGEAVSASGQYEGKGKSDLDLAKD